MYLKLNRCCDYLIASCANARSYRAYLCLRIRINPLLIDKPIYLYS